MTKQVQRRRGTATQHTSFTGAEGELSVNTTNKSVHVHDGVTAGGFEAARADLGNVSDASLNTALAGNTLSSLTITSADINGGTIDGTVIGGTTPAAVTGTTITGTSFVTTGDMTFGDNDKAIFGAGSDLQIYHDGSNSYIDDAGVGYLILKTTGTGVAIQSSATGNLLIAEDTFVKLYNAGSQKLATTATGVDVTGTITSDGLTVDKGSEGTYTSLSGDNAFGARGLSFTSSTNNGSVGAKHTINAKSASGAIVLATNSLPRALFNYNGDISFYEDTGTTPKFFWDASAEALGIGTSSPSYTLDVTESNATGAIRVYDSGSASIDTRLIAASVGNGGSGRGVAISLQPSGSSNSVEAVKLVGLQETAASSANNASFAVQVANTSGTLTERMRIDSSGSVLLNRTTSTLGGGNGNLLQIGSGSGGAGLTIHSSTTGIGDIQFADGTVGADSYRGLIRYEHSTNNMSFRVDATEAMRIDSSGSLLVGTTSADDSPDQGVQLNNIGSVGRVVVGHANGTSSGNIYAQFAYNSGAIGSITQNGTTGVSYNTSSDYRLKENVEPLTGAADRVLALKPSRFNFIADPDKVVDGFLAHEAQAVVPEAVTGEKDAVDADGKPQYQGIDQSKLVPLLTAALQEALTEIASLKARVAALEA